MRQASLWLAFVGLLLMLQWSAIGAAQKQDAPAQDKTQTGSGQTDPAAQSGPDEGSSAQESSADSSTGEQNADKDSSTGGKKPDKAANRDRQEEMSSSKDTRVDLAPPTGDEKKHPPSGAAATDAEDSNSDVQEFQAWDPHKAAKDVEVGDFYYKRKNYAAALDRYKEALHYKPNDAVATYRLAECENKTGDTSGAVTNYEAYLKILPHGPFASDAQKALERLKVDAAKEGGAK